MINNNLLQGVAALLAGSSYTIPSHLAFGSTTGTLTAADIITSGEFDRNALDSKTTTGATARLSGGRISTEANNEQVAMVGLHNSATLSSSNNLQAAFLVSSLIHTTSFDIDVEFWFTFQSG